MKTFIISGKSGHGKDCFANILKKKIEEQGKSCVIIHYADPVKWLLKECYNWDGNKDEHGRYLLQHLGTDTVRAHYPDFWTLFVSQFLDAVKEDFDYAIVPDARFINEIEVTKQYTGAKTVRIIRYNEDQSMYLNPALTLEQKLHPSEISLDDYEDFDYIVENHEGKLDLLEEAALTVLEDADGLLHK